MKKLLLCIVVILVTMSSTLVAQNQDSIDAAHAWNLSGVMRANASQIYLKDWVQGGENSVAWNVSLELGLDKDWDSWKMKNRLKSIYGMMNMGDQGFRGNENEFYLENLISKKLGWKADPYFSNTVRTVMFDAYKYANEQAEQVSTFFDPGYISQSLGFFYDDKTGFTARMGVAMQESFVNKYRQYLNGGDKNGETTFKLETGVEIVSTLKKKVMDNILYDGSVRLFTRFNGLDVWDVRWDNSITAQINKYINVNFTAIIIHEVSQTRRTQIKQGLQVGFNYLLFQK